LYFIELCDKLLSVEDINILVWTEGSSIHY